MPEGAYMSNYEASARSLPYCILQQPLFLSRLMDQLYPTLATHHHPHP